MVHETIFENVFLLIPWNLPYGTIPLTRALINKLFYDFLKAIAFDNIVLRGRKVNYFIISTIIEL